MKEFDIHLDIYDTMNNIVPVFTQFDTGGLLYLFLTERGKYLQLDKFEHFVKAKVVKPDGYAVEAICEIADEMKGIVLFRLPDQVCVTPGVLEAIVDIIDADKHKTSTHRFKLEVRDYLYDNGEIESSPEFPIIQTILAEVNDFAEQINLFAKEIEEFTLYLSNKYYLGSSNITNKIKQYDYVPLNVLEDFIESHGGIDKDATMESYEKNRPSDLKRLSYAKKVMEHSIKKNII